MNELPVYDPDLALNLAGGQTELARELLKGLAKSLPESLDTILHHISTGDTSAAIPIVHKLHGLICYCGLPRLKVEVAGLEKALKQAELEPVTKALDRFVAACREFSALGIR